VVSNSKCECPSRGDAAFGAFSLATKVHGTVITPVFLVDANVGKHLIERFIGSGINPTEFRSFVGQRSNIYNLLDKDELIPRIRDIESTGEWNGSSNTSGAENVRN
jgi:hypothetical protein